MWRSFRCRYFFLLLLMIFALVLAACGGKNRLEPVDQDAYGITFHDDMGRQVTVEAAERIVSLAPSSTEILFALEGEKVVSG